MVVQFPEPEAGIRLEAELLELVRLARCMHSLDLLPVLLELIMACLDDI